MPKKGYLKSTQPIGDPNNRNSLYNQQQSFLRHLAEKNFTQATIKNRNDYLTAFILWCDDRALKTIQDITKPIIELYQRHLHNHRKKDNQPLSIASQKVRITSIKVWFKWLSKNNRILYNPASEIELPRDVHRLPKHILSHDDIQQIFKQPDISTVLGLRDRAILETFYSTGIRRSELANLKQQDIDAQRGTIIIRQGKGQKDRLIPIGNRALDWIKQYQSHSRMELQINNNDDSLFLSHLGEALTGNRISQLVRNHIKAANIGKSGSCHLFRHAMATQMLENGADIRYIQVMLGHASLESTKIYTQVSIKKLKDIHTATHPAR
jgi:integrase/recombinase XerD